MSLPETTRPDQAERPSLRERKKLATRRALQRVALDLVTERGYPHVTVEDIAAAADVSPRTFFNYFPSKEAALLGVDLSAPSRSAAASWTSPQTKARSKRCGQSSWTRPAASPTNSPTWVVNG